MEDRPSHRQILKFQRLARTSETNPNFLDEPMILVVSREESSIESSGVDKSLEQVFAAESSVKSLMMTSVEMETDKADLEDLINKAEDKIELNLVELIQVDNTDYMKQLQGNLDWYYEACSQKLCEWRPTYATILDVDVETALQTMLTKFKQDLIDYKISAVFRQANLPVAVATVP